MIFAKTGDDVQIFGALVCVGVYLVFDGVRRSLKKRRVQDTARHSIAHAPQGNVEIEGFAWALNEPVKNASGQLCAYYKLKLQRLEKHGKNSSWVTRWEHAPHAAFVLLDRTGALIVFDQNAEMTCHSQITSWSNVVSTNPAHQLVPLIEAGYGPVPTGFFSQSHRLLEEYITLGSPCYAQGCFLSDDSKNFKAKQWTMETFFEYIKKRPPGDIHQNLKFDIDDDGTVTDDEASEALHKVAKNIIDMEIKPTTVTQEAAPGTFKFFGKMITTPDHKLLVAAMHEHHLVQKVGSANILRIIGGALLASASVAYIAMRIGN